MRRLLSWFRRRRVMRHHYIEQRLRNYKAQRCQTCGGELLPITDEMVVRALDGSAWRDIRYGNDGGHTDAFLSMRAALEAAFRDKETD